MFFLELKYKINIIQPVGHIFHTDKSSPIASSPKSSTKKISKMIKNIRLFGGKSKQHFYSMKKVSQNVKINISKAWKKDAIHFNHMYLYVFVIFRQGGPVQLKAGVNEGLYKQ